ncbi:hypothetical protein KCP69_21745 [Salmonella enterica subsp. enterica]|nr:hypothetical protein KCP69_21745 [Salmonella enterica subsp. enterica]
MKEALATEVRLLPWRTKNRAGNGYMEKTEIIGSLLRRDQGKRNTPRHAAHWVYITGVILRSSSKRAAQTMGAYCRNDARAERTALKG